MKLLAVIPGAGKAIRLYRNSKFYEHNKNRDGSGLPVLKSLRNPKFFKSGMFSQYFMRCTRCEFVGHEPRPATRKNHFATCAHCYGFCYEQGYGWGWTPEIELAKHPKDPRTYCEECKVGYLNEKGVCWQCEY